MTTQKTTIQTPYAVAFKLLTLGFSVIPSGKGDKGKAPLVDWKPYQDKPADEAQLQHWQDELAPQLWGIVTNASVAVIDADTPETRAKLEATLGQCHVLTPRGGGHWYIDTTGHPFKTVAPLLPGVDSRGVGGFVNVVGRSGLGEYTIVNLPILGENLIPYTKLPQQILVALDTPSAKAPKGEPITIPEGERNASLTSIAGAMRRKGADRAAIEAALLTINHEQCQPPLPEPEVKRIAQSTSGYAPAPAKPSTQKENVDKWNGHHPELKMLSGVRAETVKWLWEPYIPYGKLTLIEGDPGVGKSWLTLAIVTALSLGHGFPRQSALAHGPSLIASAEDGLADTIKPRLSAMGANTKIIQAIDGLFTLDDAGFQWLEDAICASDPLPLLLVVDPLVAYLSGDMDINKANQVRFATARLGKIADKYGLAIIAVRHLTKGGSLKPIYRGLGSIDFVASARSVLLAGEDPDAPQSRGFVHIKSNLAPKGEAVGYELRDGNFYWLEHTELTQEKILGAAREDESSPSLEAKELILNALCQGAIPAAEVLSEARAKGVSGRTLNRAKKELGVSTYRDGQPGRKGGGQWLWKLPQQTD